MKNEFDLLFENILSSLSDAPTLVPAPNSELEVTVVSEEMTELEIADKMLKEIKGLRKIARQNDFDSKIYYRARNIEDLAKKLKTMHGGSVEGDSEEDSD